MKIKKIPHSQNSSKIRYQRQNGYL